MIDVLQYIKKFPKVHVLVIGDIMLDEYIEGSAERISPEAPIPVLLQKSVRHVLGGASNVAANIAALGGSPTLIGIVGRDAHGRIVRRLCRTKHIATHLLVGSGPTTTKTRFVSGHFQLVRIDVEEISALSEDAEARLVRTIRELPPHDIVVISDYAKGVISQAVIAALRSRFGAQKIVADMKPVNASLYRNIFAMTPNIREAFDMTGVLATSDALAERVTKTLAGRLKTSIVLTRGEAGVSAREKGKKCKHFRNSVQTVKDVTGAGDTLIAVLALMRASGSSLSEAAEVANHAAGIVVGKAGTVALSGKELRAAYKRAV